MSSAIAVHVRLRPHKHSDGAMDENALAIGEKSVTSYSDYRHRRYKFRFDQCHGQGSTQEEVFEKMEPLLQEVFKGQNASIFAYGVTGSGKTHTMQGTYSAPGIIPRTVEAIFKEKIYATGQSEMEVSFSYVEILKDEVYDLLGDRSGGRKLDLRTDASGNVIVAELNVLPISSVYEFETLFQEAAGVRKTASTKLNISSSRSHAILTLHVRVTEKASGKTTIGKICLIDLAGSENNNLTGNDAERMRESSAINKSLTVLGNVVDAINKKASRIPYRDSKLTRLLQDALGGSSLGLILCCLAPGAKFAKDTNNTLNFATRTKQVEKCVAFNSKASEPSARVALAGPRRVTFGPQAPSVNPAINVLRPLSAQVQNRTISNLPISRRISLPAKQSTVNYQTSARGISGITGVVEQEVRENDGLTKDQLKLMFEEMWEAKQKTQGQELAMAPPPRPSTEPIERKTASPLVPQNKLEVPQPLEAIQVGDIVQGISPEEKKSRARVLVELARNHQTNNELPAALTHYEKALIYLPDNQRLLDRITNIKMAIEGLVSPPRLSGRSGSQQVNEPGPSTSISSTFAERPVLRSSTKRARQPMSDILHANRKDVRGVEGSASSSGSTMRKRGRV